MVLQKLIERRARLKTLGVKKRWQHQGEPERPGKNTEPVLQVARYPLEKGGDSFIFVCSRWQATVHPKALPKNLEHSNKRTFSLYTGVFPRAAGNGSVIHDLWGCKSGT